MSLQLSRTARRAASEAVPLAASLRQSLGSTAATLSTNAASPAATLLSGARFAVHGWFAPRRDGFPLLRTSAAYFSSFSNNDEGNNDNHNDGDDATNSDDSEESGELKRAVAVLRDHARNELTGPLAIPPKWPEAIAIPIASNPVFPKFFKVLHVTDKALIRQLKSAVKRKEPWAATFLRKDNRPETDPLADAADIKPVGTFVQVYGVDENTDGSAKVLVQGVRRVFMTGSKEPVPDTTDNVVVVKIENAQHLPFEEHSEQIKAYSQEIIKTIKEIVHMSPLYRQSIHQVMEMGHKILDSPANLADFGAALTSAETGKLQSVLEEMNVERRLKKSLELVKEEYLQLKLQQEISKEVEDKISKTRRTAMLQEQLKVIQKELGLAKDDKESLIEKFTARLTSLKLPETTKTVVDEELSKLRVLDPNSSEFSVTRNYLDWLTAVPWGVRTEDNLDIAHAATTLDQRHFGMADVKERVLEFIAVAALKGDTQGKILCFVGPPGVGKTSIAKSMAEALHRKYFRFSVGGLHDVSEIKGHRRTYVGAMPGKPVQSLKKAGTENPLVLIDEIDKLGRGPHGDPTSALLELLDPEQNHTFMDHYLDVPVDMSKVLFVCTANTLETIPAPLLDRMEVIDLAGYTAAEKLAIAKQYLLPAAQKASGVRAGFAVSDAALEQLMRGYCRESGVRNLQKHIDKIYRKAALRQVRATPAPTTASTESGTGASSVTDVTPANLVGYVGNPPFTTDRLYPAMAPPGVVMGLAWTAMGGTVLYIESTYATRDAPGFSITGKLGEVMRESATIAYSYAQNYLCEHAPSNDFFGKAKISMHVPEGATPKDGPSAGITMVTALLSLATHTPVRPDLAMTGEVSLTGKVLRVGGIKEKVLAARRANAIVLILPAGNEPDYRDLPADVRDGLTVHFVSHYTEVFPVAFPSS